MLRVLFLDPPPHVRDPEGIHRVYTRAVGLEGAWTATGGFSALLGVRPAAGWLFGPEQDHQAAEPVAVTIVPARRAARVDPLLVAPAECGVERRRLAVAPRRADDSGSSAACKRRIIGALCAGGSTSGAEW